MLFRAPVEDLSFIFPVSSSDVPSGHASDLTPVLPELHAVFFLSWKRKNAVTTRYTLLFDRHLLSFFFLSSLPVTDDVRLCPLNNNDYVVRPAYILLPKQEQHIFRELSPFRSGPFLLLLSN